MAFSHISHWKLTKKVAIHSEMLLSPTLFKSILTYLWISPSIKPKLTLKVASCFREERGGGELCCGPDWRPVSCVGEELIPWWICNVCCLVEDREGHLQSCFPVWGLVSWLSVCPASFCARRSFFSWQDNWGLRRRTRVPPTQRTLNPQKTKQLLSGLFIWKANVSSC